MDQQSPPRATLIIGTHDRWQYLEEAVSAAHAQTYPHLDIVLSDDGSQAPELLVLLDRYEQEGIRTLRHPRAGFSAATNATVRAIDTEYIMILGDDDVIEPSYIADAVEVAQRDPHIGIVYCEADFIGTKQGAWDLPDFDIGSILIDNQIFATALFRRQDWLAVGGYDESMTEGREDHDFILKILGIGRKAHRLPEILFHYRQHDQPPLNAVTGRSAQKRARAYATIFRNNNQLYLEHAEEFWLHFFRQLGESHDIKLRYRHLEAVRQRHPRAYGIARTLRRRGASLRRKLGTRRGSR